MDAQQKFNIFFIVTAAVLAGSSWALAAETPQECRSERGGYCVRVAAIASAQTGVPGLEFLQISPGVQPGELISVIYRFGIGLVGLAALAMFIWGGIEYMFAGEKQPAEAKKRMKNALIGLLLALGSYLILFTINPQLVRTLDLGLTPLRLQQTPTQTTITPEQAHSCLKDPACVERARRQTITFGGVARTATNKTCVGHADCTRQGVGDYCDPGSGICFAPRSQNQQTTAPLYNDLEQRFLGRGFLPVNKPCQLYTQCGGNDINKYACIASGNTNQKRCWVKGDLPGGPTLPATPGAIE